MSRDLSLVSMLKDTFSSSWLVRGVTVAAILALSGGCKKEEPVPAAEPPPAVAPPPTAAATPVPVAPEETFALSDVTFRYEEKNSILFVSYRVSSRSAKRERVSLCVDLIDKDGFFVEDGRMFDQFSLRPGDSDEVVDDANGVSPDVWKATEVLQFYLYDGSCQKNAFWRRSNVLLLAKSGLPLPPGTEVAGKVSEVEAELVLEPWFRLEDVRVSQSPKGEVRADYRITNLTKGRAASQLCVRLANDTSCSCKSLDKAESETFNLGLNASERLSTRLDLSDNENWSRGRQLIIYTAPLGCFGPPEEATSNVVILPKPRSIQAPEPPEEEL